ncbi:MAG: YbhB/YbcL family Raf kinase inhibitor-like protein [Chthonomonadales bacterium]|nr:YbhB/YbcL family Raf kinase inhibitor-like protein [Chthonomonadales bacterium]
MLRRWSCAALALGAAAAAPLGGCSRGGDSPAAPPAIAGPGGRPAASLSVASSAFAGGEPIPAQYTCDGANVSPPLRWSGVPAKARSLALVCDDPDAPSGTWVHWVIYGVAPDAPGMPEAAPVAAARQGVNDFGKVSYGGPCPPPGDPHRYHFRLYALDEALSLRPGASRAELDGAMRGHVLAQGELIGTYGRH